MFFVRLEISRILRALSLTVLLSAGATLGVGALQLTSASASTCEGSGWSCFWANSNFSGPPGPGNFSTTNSSWRKFSSDGACIPGRTAAQTNRGRWNDCASSAKNFQAYGMALYANSHCSGFEWTLPAGGQISNLGNHSLNDKISSDHYPGTGSC